MFRTHFLSYKPRFRHLLPVFEDSKARGGIRGNGGKDSSRVSRRAVFAPEGETGPFRGP